MKLLTLLQGRILDIMLGKAGILVDLKFGGKVLKLCKLLEALEGERDGSFKCVSLVDCMTPLKSAITCIVPCVKNESDNQGKLQALNRSDLRKLQNTVNHNFHQSL